MFMCADSRGSMDAAARSGLRADKLAMLSRLIMQASERHQLPDRWRPTIQSERKKMLRRDDPPPVRERPVRGRDVGVAQRMPGSGHELHLEEDLSEGVAKVLAHCAS